MFLIKTALLIDMTFFTLLSCDYHEYSHAFVLFCRLGQMQISGLKKIQAFVQNGYLWTFWNFFDGKSYMKWNKIQDGLYICLNYEMK